MKINVNRNVFWSEILVQALINIGVRNVCISPGSRSTPLIFALENEKKIKKHVILDERENAFFALGLAKAANAPVAIVTTSGTAVAELYPAIIEAYFQRIPLVVISADRPAYLRNTGANQTINQNNIFVNHIRAFLETSADEISKKNITSFISNLETLFSIGLISDLGPVHINFQFDKPFEPDNHTDIIDQNLMTNYNFKLYNSVSNDKIKIHTDIRQFTRKIFLVGDNNFKPEELNELILTSNKYRIPILADINSNIRFSFNSKYLISLHSIFFKSKKIEKMICPDLIIQFGNAPIANSVLGFFENSTAYKISVNKFGDLKDPSKTMSAVYKSTPNEFCDFIKNYFVENDKEFVDEIAKANDKARKIITKYLTKTDKLFEGYWVNVILDCIKPKSNLMFGNSMPIRLFDNLGIVKTENVTVFSNRGASGIDGLISTAAGIADVTKKETILILGDLSFIYSANAFNNFNLKKLKLKIVVLNNNGGGIFKMLPIMKYKKILKKYFVTNFKLSIKDLCEVYGIDYLLAKSKKDCECFFLQTSNSISILEIQTDSDITADFIEQLVERIEEYAN